MIVNKIDRKFFIIKRGMPNLRSGTPLWQKRPIALVAESY